MSDECENGTIITTSADTYAAVTCAKAMIIQWSRLEYRGTNRSHRESAVDLAVESE